MRLIDAYALYEFIKDQMEKETGAYTRGKNTAFNIVKSALNNQCATPTIDAVPVVRCKDCKYWYRDRANIHRGDCLEIVPEAWMNENDFCSYGVKKDE